MPVNRRQFLIATTSAVIGPLVFYDAADAQVVRYIPGEPYRLRLVSHSELDPQYWRQLVFVDSNAPAGIVVVDTQQKFLFLMLGSGRALRYGIGIGREGFAWSGTATIRLKRKWPKWTPPKEMIERDPRTAKFANGMPGGPDNPLGARALYLFQGNRDTLYRIHGSNEVASIGNAVSSGCVRLLNQDVIDLYDRVPIGTRVIVLPDEQIVRSQPFSEARRARGQPLDKFPNVAVGPRARSEQNDIISEFFEKLFGG